MQFSVIVAMTESKGIGKKGQLPWAPRTLKHDMQFFKRLTTTGMQSTPSRPNAVIMGRKTWDSIPAKYRPLPGRINIVVSRNPQSVVTVDTPQVHVCTSLHNALEYNATAINHVFVIGGGQIYEQALKDPRCTRVFATQLVADAIRDCDVSMPDMDGFRPDRDVRDFIAPVVMPAAVVDDNGFQYRFEAYVRFDSM